MHDLAVIPRMHDLAVIPRMHDLRNAAVCSTSVDAFSRFQ
jgi:hypothetical protein